MKRIIFSILIVAWSLLVFSCHKNDAPATATIVVSPFAGTYKGSVIDTLYDFYFGTTADYVIEIKSTTVAGQVKLVNSPINADTAFISGNIFTIPKKITIDNNVYLRAEEFASGIFSGPGNDTLKAVFNYNSYKVTNGTIGSQYRRTCVFVKQ